LVTSQVTPSAEKYHHAANRAAENWRKARTLANDKFSAFFDFSFSFIAALIVASLQEKRLRIRATVRERKERGR
jgi:hypothetical protein